MIAWLGASIRSPQVWNKRWYDYTGLSAEASLGPGWLEAIHPEDREKVTGADYLSLEVEARLRRFDGIDPWFLFRSEACDGAEGGYGVAIDIEERKQHEQQFRAITDLIPQYIVVLAPDGNVLYVNRVALERTGIDMADVQGEDSFWLPFHPDDVERVRTERRQGLTRGVPFELEVRVRLTHGLYRWHLVQYNPQKDEAGQILRWYATGTDIDERKKAEESLRNENLALREEVDRFSMFDDIVGTSKPMRHLLQQVAKVAPSDSTVLILGETGTGKELVARALHRRSNRSSRIFIATPRLRRYWRRQVTELSFPIYGVTAARGYQFYFATERGRDGYEKYRKEFAKLIWRTASPKWNFDDATFNRTATAFDNPDHVAITIHNYRWRLGLAEGESKYDAFETRLAQAPVIKVPTITLEGDANGAPHPDPANYAKKFSGKYAHRTVKGGIGHNLPQEAPREFAQAVIDVAAQAKS